TTRWGRSRCSPLSPSRSSLSYACGSAGARRSTMADREIILYRLATPITLALLVIGFHFFLRGHNAPGGGFIAGRIIAVAALLVRLAQQHKLFSFEPYLLVPAGLLVALLTGLVPMLVGLPFLTSAHGHFDNGPLAG